MRSLEKIAVDANPILSAIIGGKSREVFLRAEMTSFYTTAFNVKEVEKYVPVFSKKHGIPLEDLYLSLFMLPFFVCDEDFYKEHIREAKRLIEKRDPDDHHLVALALKLQCPVWSNDRDFEGIGVEVYTTLDFLKGLSGEQD